MFHQFPTRNGSSSSPESVTCQMSKRPREADLLLTCSNPDDLWNNILVPDVQQTILSSVSPLEHLLFALTCKTTYAFCRPRLVKHGFHTLLMQYGTEHLCEAYRDEFADGETAWDEVAAGAGNVETLKWYRFHGPEDRISCDVTNAALTHGGMEIVEFCFGGFVDTRLGAWQVEMLCKGNAGIELIDCLIKHSCVQSPVLLKYALNCGNSRIARHLMDMGERSSFKSMGHAIRGKNLDCVKLVSTCCSLDFEKACAHGTAEILDYLWDLFGGHVVRCIDYMELAIAHSNLPSVKWLHDHGFPVPQGIYYPIDLEMLQFLVKIGMPKNPSMLSKVRTSNIATLNAAKHMGFDLSQYGYNDFNWDIAAMGWLHEQGYPWTPGLFALAIEEKGSEHLEWLYQRGCPFGTQCMETAINKQSLEIVTWLVEHGCPCHAMDFEFALIRGYLDIADYLWNHGIRYNTDPTQSKLPYVRNVKTKEWIERHPIN